MTGGGAREEEEEEERAREEEEEELKAEAVVINEQISQEDVLVAMTEGQVSGCAFRV